MSVLTDVRSKLAVVNVNELNIVDNQPALFDLWTRMQDLREEMNLAKKAASHLAAMPYLELIENLEKQYALLLRLSA